MMGKLTSSPLRCLPQNPSTTNFLMFHFLTFVVLNRTSPSNSPPPGSAPIQALNNLVVSIALAQAAAKLNQQQQGMVPAATQSPLAGLFPGFGVAPPVQSSSAPPGFFGLGGTHVPPRNFPTNNPTPAPPTAGLPSNNPNSHLISQLQQTMAAVAAVQKAEQEQNKHSPPTPQLSQKEKHAMELKAAFEDQQKAL
jgi:hypothetical protein